MDPSIFCAICDGPISKPGSSDALEWQTRLVLLSDPSLEFETREHHYKGGKRPEATELEFKTDAKIQCDRAVIIDNNVCKLLDTGEEVKPNEHAGFDANHERIGMYRIAAHEACVDIAQRVMRSSKQVGLAVRSMRTLWKVLRMRFDVRDNEHMGSTNRPWSSRVEMWNTYYHRTNRHRIGRDEVGTPGGNWDEADPIVVPEITDTIVDSLRTTNTRVLTAAATGFQERFMVLPTELRDQVASFLVTAQGLPLQCNRRIPQQAWLDILSRGVVAPFLWDLDGTQLSRAFEEKATPGCEVDWELITRALTQRFAPSQRREGDFLRSYSSLRLPAGLCNRKRIWQLVEEMFVGDALMRFSQVDEMPEVPRYWDRFGDPLYPVLRTGPLG